MGIGIAGYVAFERLPCLGAFPKAATLLDSIRPVDLPKAEAGKLFAGCNALHAGLVFIATAALVLTPLLYRVLHRFHWDECA